MALHLIFTVWYGYVFYRILWRSDTLAVIAVAVVAAGLTFSGAGPLVIAFAAATSFLIWRCTDDAVAIPIALATAGLFFIAGVPV